MAPLFYFTVYAQQPATVLAERRESSSFIWMRDAKIVLLLLVLLCLIGTWIFYFYDKAARAGSAVVQLQNQKNESFAERDSLVTLYRQAVSQLNSLTRDRSALNEDLQMRVQQIDTLQTEMNRVLQLNQLTREQLNNALQQIALLQQRIAGSNAGNVKQNPAAVASNLSTKGVNNKVPEATAATDAAEWLIKTGKLNIRFLRATVPEQITDKAAEAVAMQLQIDATPAGSAKFAVAALYLVVRSPLGEIVQDDAWQTGVFDAGKQGRLRYTRRYEITGNESGGVTYTTLIELPSFEKGVYRASLYYKGNELTKKEARLQ